MSQEVMNEHLREKIDHLTSSPGVYLFKDNKNEVIYVGKAKRLNSRVRSYFQSLTDQTGKTRVMVRKIYDLEVIITDSEAEALILENNLIKKYHPRYNILYRDDKTYPYICMTREDRPRVFPTRTVIRDGSHYYGPYDHVGKMRQMLETIRKAFQLCTCACSSRMVDRSKGLPKWRNCFEDYFENCSIDMDEEEYQYRMGQVIRLLNGKTRSLIKELKKEMEEYSQLLDFEKAAVLRDGIFALEKYSSKMKIVSSDGMDRDIFAIKVEWDENVACGVLLQVREGKLLNKHHRFLKNIEGLNESSLIQSFIEDYYTSELPSIIPDEICCSRELMNNEPLFEYLWQVKEKKVPILVPQRGEKAKMVHMAGANAQILLQEWVLEKVQAEKGRVPHSVMALERDIHLDRLPRRIECFDISNFQGSYSVASMVCFVDGHPRRSEYKRFHIKSVNGPDDFASMKEVIQRRYKRVKQEGQQIPDLVVVDGGKGQLSSAIKAIDEINFSHQLPIIGLAKRLEEIYIPAHSDPIMIPKTSSSLKLLQRIRDEAHRFAVNFHRDTRSKKTFRSELQEIHGVGIKTTEKLINKFGSVDVIQNLNKIELVKVVGEKAGDSIYRYFHKSQ